MGSKEKVPTDDTLNMDIYCWQQGPSAVTGAYVDSRALPNLCVPHSKIPFAALDCNSMSRAIFICYFYRINVADYSKRAVVHCALCSDE